MWEFFKTIFEATGLLGLIAIGEALIIAACLRMYHSKDKRVEQLQAKLLDTNEKRLLDVVEDRSRYEELAKELQTTIRTLIQVYKKNGGVS